MKNSNSALVFTKEQGQVVLTTALKILTRWQAAPEQTCSILGVSSKTISCAKQGIPVDISFNMFERASIVLNCHAALRLTFENPENVYGFVSMVNHNEFFNGRKPLEIMAQGDMQSLFETYKRIEAIREAAC